MASTYSHHMVDAATVVVAAGWIGLWSLWPDFRQWDDRSPGMPAPRVSFIRSAGDGQLHATPDLFGRPSRVGFAPDAKTGGVMDRLLSEPVREPRYLERRNGDAAPAAAGAMPLSVALGEYRTVWPEPPALGMFPAAQEMRLTVDVSGEIGKRGFVPPEFTADERKVFDKAWQVVARIEVDERGRVADVLLEAGSEDAAINAVVLKALHRGKVPDAALGARYSGRVSMSYGRP